MTNENVIQYVKESLPVLERAEQLKLITAEQKSAAYSYIPVFEKATHLDQLSPLRVKIEALQDAIAKVQEGSDLDTERKNLESKLAHVNDKLMANERDVHDAKEIARGKTARMLLPQTVDIFKQYAEGQGNYTELNQNLRDENETLRKTIEARVTPFDYKLPHLNMREEAEDLHQSVYGAGYRAGLNTQPKKKNRLLPFALLLGGLGMGVAGYFTYPKINPCAEVPVVEATPVPTAVPTAQPTPQPTAAKTQVTSKPKPKAKKTPAPVAQSTPAPQASDDDLSGEQELKKL